MFKIPPLKQIRRAIKIETPRPSRVSLEHMHDVQMHNVCEYNEKADIGWNAGMNL